MTEQSVTILSPEMYGVMSISGYRGLGKSFLASQADLPENIICLDFENKGQSINAQLNFGRYLAPAQKAGDSPQALYNITMGAINAMEQDRFTVAILDNISPFETALNAEASNKAETYAPRYGLNLKNVKANRFGGARAIVNFMISDICAKLHSKGVRLIITTSHIKERWTPGGPLPNKYNVKGADKWQELSILTLILIPGSTPPVPAALVQKEQLGTISISNQLTDAQLDAIRRGESGHVIQRRLPQKIDPCTFQKLRWYLHNPVNFDNLQATEMPTKEEADPFDQRLDKEQFSIMKLALEQREREEREEKELESQEAHMALLAKARQWFMEDGEINPLELAQKIECEIPVAANLLLQLRKEK